MRSKKSCHSWPTVSDFHSTFLLTYVEIVMMIDMMASAEDFTTEQMCQMRRILMQASFIKQNFSLVNCSEGYQSENREFFGTNLSQSANNKPANAITSVHILYTVLTPLVVLVGIVGNSLCIRVFSDRRMRGQTASIYIATLAVADLGVLLLYVVPEWLQRGLALLIREPRLNVLANQGVCQVLLYFSYTIRLLSVWMLVTSTVERYVGVCHPMIRRRICSTEKAKKIITLVVFVSCLVCIWKPVSQVSYLQGQLGATCTYQIQTLSLILDTAYAAFLTIIPSFIIIIFNILISRHLLIIRRSDNCLSSQELLGVQFAVLLVMVSTCFLLLTWPYYITWLHLWRLQLNEDHTKPRIHAQSHFIPVDRALYVTRVFYYLNYSVNFFLYNFASGYFRSEMKRMFTLRIERLRSRRFYETYDMRLHLGIAACNSIEAADALVDQRSENNAAQLNGNRETEDSSDALTDRRLNHNLNLIQKSSIYRPTIRNAANPLIEAGCGIVDIDVMKNSLRCKKSVRICVP